jgi:hypothetical protein
MCTTCFDDFWRVYQVFDDCWPLRWWCLQLVLTIVYHVFWRCVHLCLTMFTTLFDVVLPCVWRCLHVVDDGYHLSDGVLPLVLTMFDHVFRICWPWFFVFGNHVLYMLTIFLHIMTFVLLWCHKCVLYSLLPFVGAPRMEEARVDPKKTGKTEKTWVCTVIVVLNIQLSQCVNPIRRSVVSEVTGM